MTCAPRSLIQPTAGSINFIKVYEVEIAGATDVSGIDALAEAGVDPVDNMEGISWGPELENGNRSLVLVSDNNFNDTQVSQVIVVEVAG